MTLSALTVGEMFSVGGITTLLGLGMTFVVLALLIVLIMFINLILKYLTQWLDKSKASSKAKKASVAASLSEEKIPEAEKSETDISAEKMLAIRSAVEIYLRENANDGKKHDNPEIVSVRKL